jgi:hypothetical protein
VESPFHPLAAVLGVGYYLQLCQDVYAGVSPAAARCAVRGVGGRRRAVVQL